MERSSGANKRVNRVYYILKHLSPEGWWDYILVTMRSDSIDLNRKRCLGADGLFVTQWQMQQLADRSSKLAVQLSWIRHHPMTRSL